MSQFTWLDPDEQRLLRAFVRSARWLLVQLDRDLQREMDLPRTFFEILLILYRTPGQALRMSELAAATGSQPSSTTHAVSSLERSGYVRRELCAEDRRSWFAVLTEEGLEALMDAAPRFAASVRAGLTDRLSPEQRAQLTEIGETLIRGFEGSGAPPLYAGAASRGGQAVAKDADRGVTSSEGMHPGRAKDEVGAVGRAGESSRDRRGPMSQ